MNLSDLTALATLPTLTAGMAIAKGDLVESADVSGTAMPGKITGYAIVDAIGTSIMSATQIIGNGGEANFRPAVVQGSNSQANGRIYTITRTNSSSGALLTKFNSVGSLTDLVTSINLDTSDTYNSHRVFTLSNGNILAISYNGTSNTINFGIYTPALVTVKSWTALAASAASQYLFGACTLSGGGFAVVHQTSATPLNSTLLTFDNDGTAVLAATTVFTRTGTTGAQKHAMLQLSNGNLVIAVSSSNTVSSIGLFHGVVTTAGVSVLAFTSLDTASVSIFPELEVLPGYYAVARPNGTDQKAYVFNNAGTLQGTAFSAATTIATEQKTKLTSDGTSFWLIWQDQVNAKSQVTKLPTTGTGYFNNIGTYYNQYVDAFCENNTLVRCDQTGDAQAFQLTSHSTVTGIRTVIAPQNIDTAITTNGFQQRLIPGGDGTYICVYYFSDTAATKLRIGKYSNTAIVGVAAAAAAAGALVPVIQTAGNYACNELGGALNNSFDMSATIVRGNKGSLSSKSVNLKGI